MYQRHTAKVIATLAISTFILSAAVTGFPANAATIGRPGDYNGDKYRDLAIGAPFTIVSGIDGAGAVGVVRGAPTGPTPATYYQRLDQTRSWIPSDPRLEEAFGESLASGDLNGDGYSELIVCTPYETDQTNSMPRALTVAFGSANGLSRSFYLAAPRMRPVAIASADFNKDGYADIVASGDGLPVVAYGGRDVTSPSGFEFVELKSTIKDALRFAEPATGDVNGDSYPDAVIGHHRSDETQVFLLFEGGPSGLTTKPTQTWAGPGSSRIAIGDIDGDRNAEVVAGDETAVVGGTGYAGRVLLWKGTNGGVETSRTRVITQDTPGVPGAAEADDEFGYSVALGDANGDGLADLAVGSPGERLGTSSMAGMVTVIPGAKTGLNYAAAQGFSQNTTGMPDTAETGDQFGFALLFRDLNADGRMDLAASSLGENVQQGSVHVLRGSAGGITGAGASALYPAQFGIPLTRAFFGYSLG